MRESPELSIPMAASGAAATSSRRWLASGDGGWLSRGDGGIEPSSSRFCRASCVAHRAAASHCDKAHCLINASLCTANLHTNCKAMLIERSVPSERLCPAKYTWRPTRTTRLHMEVSSAEWCRAAHFRVPW
jgi:hypothetical protein